MILAHDTDRGLLSLFIIKISNANEYRVSGVNASLALALKKNKQAFSGELNYNWHRMFRKPSTDSGTKHSRFRSLESRFPVGLWSENKRGENTLSSEASQAERSLLASLANYFSPRSFSLHNPNYGAWSQARYFVLTNTGI